MDIDLLGKSPVGKLVPVKGTDARHGPYAYFAFLPDPLPSDVQLTSATWNEVAEATAGISRLQQACRQLPDPRLLIRPALWRESLDTSALEGTEGELRELLEAQLPSARFLSSDTREIQAFEFTAVHAFAVIRQRPITVPFLCELQGELFQGHPHPPQDVGRVRQNIVWIGQKDRPIEEARFVPAPPDDRLKAGLDQWEEWVQAEQTHLAPVLRNALAHYQLEALHPFGDGNGRIGRLVIILHALRSGSLSHPALILSPWLLRNRVQYQDQLLQMSCTGDWNPWVTLFCRAVREQCDLVIESAQKLLVWLGESRRKVEGKRWTGVIHRLLDDLIEWPVTSIGDVAIKYKVSTVHATRVVNHLVEIGILVELTGKDYGRIFGAQYVMDTVDTLT
jgi:Fic family protein